MMKKVVAGFEMVVGMAILGIILAGIWGCELTSDPGEVTIRPDSAALREGESITLTASGGRTYLWQLEHEDWGRLNTRRGDTVVYTSHYTPPWGQSAVQKVLVTADSVGTNATPTKLKAEAYITHRPEGGVALRLKPTTATLHAVGATATFSVTGGTRYQWSLSQPTWGTLSHLTGERTTYRNLRAPAADGGLEIQVLTVRDVVSGQEARAEIYLHLP